MLEWTNKQMVVFLVILNVSVFLVAFSIACMFEIPSWQVRISIGFVADAIVNLVVTAFIATR